MNLVRMPAIQTLMLFSKTIATNGTLSKFVFDEFLTTDVPYFGQGKTLLMRAVGLRRKWSEKLESKLENPYHEIDEKEIFYFVEDLVAFMTTEVSYNIKRLLPADLKVIYTDSEPLEMPPAPNPFDSNFTPKPNSTFGGLQVTENIIYDCLVQEEWAEQIEEQMTMSPFECPVCDFSRTGLSLYEMLQHEADCKNKVKVEEGEQSETQEVAVIKPNSKVFCCESCGKDLMLTPVEILKHKRTCKC